MRPYIVLPWISGTAALVLGVFAARRDLAGARGIDKLVVLGPVLMAAPLAAFAAEHMTLSDFIQTMIPAWYPARLFLSYSVGVALYAAALSLALRRYISLSAGLLAVMFLLFVTTMHVPNSMHATDRFGWIVSLRDLTFGAGALALAGAFGLGRRANNDSPYATIGRVLVGAACIVFGVLHLIYPANAPGVPLQKMTPPWIPLPSAWGYLTGALEIVLGAMMLLDRHTRMAAAWFGLWIVILVLIIYAPFVATAAEGNEKLEALNYVWDTLLFAGTVLAIAVPRGMQDAVGHTETRERPRDEK